MMRWAVALAGPRVCSAHSASRAAGMLPAHSWPTTFHGTRRWRARLTVPPILVKAANSKSVPTAMWGLMPKKEDEDGRHQRATAHASESDDQTHRETRKDKRQFMHGGECRGASYGSKLLFCASNMQI